MMTVTPSKNCEPEAEPITTFNNQHFHLKNEDYGLCMGIRNETYDRFIRTNCSANMELLWIVDILPQQNKNDSPMRICHSIGNKCLAVGEINGESNHLVVDAYNRTSENQQWHFKKESGRLVHLETHLCLANYPKFVLSPNKATRLLYGMTCDIKNREIMPQLKWNLIPVFEN